MQITLNNSRAQDQSEDDNEAAELVTVE